MNYNHSHGLNAYDPSILYNTPNGTYGPYSIPLTQIEPLRRDFNIEHLN